MSFMNRKMFNRNARNKLNAMGGVTSFQLGGSPLMATNPLTKSRGSRGIPTSGIGAVQDINPELINLLIILVYIFFVKGFKCPSFNRLSDFFHEFLIKINIM